MRNGTLSNLNKLVLVNSSGLPIQGQDSIDDAALDYHASSESDNPDAFEELRKKRATLIIFMAVSIACLTTALATGSYAIWLARHQAAEQALTDVNDLLKSCQSRMQQLEADIQRLPEREA